MAEPLGSAVWVTRPAPANETTAAALTAAGFAAVRVPVLEVRLLDAPRLPSADLPDWIVLVSSNAARGLARAMHAAAVPTAGLRVASVGAATAGTATSLGFNVALRPETQDAAGLLAALAGESLAGCRIWVPAGNRAGSARDQLPAALGQRGAVVSVFDVYETHARPVSEKDRQALGAAEPWAMLLHSPSAVEAVYADATAEVRAWRERATAVAIGPATRQRLRDCGGQTVLEADAPTDEAVIEALVTLRQPPLPVTR